MTEVNGPIAPTSNPIPDINTINTVDLKQKNLFEQALDKLDLQGTLTLLTVLSERALFLNSKDMLTKQKVVKPNGRISG